MAQDDIQGQVVDPSGNPVSGAIVELTKSFESNPVEEQTVLRTTTDSNGNYIFESHPDGDGTTQDYHVSCYNHDGSAYVNSFNNPGVTADLPSNAIPDSGVLDWPINEGSGTVANESIDTYGDQDGSINGATWVSDNAWYDGFYLDCDETDDYILTGDWGSFSPGVLDSAFTIIMECSIPSGSDGYALGVNDADETDDILGIGPRSFLSGTDGAWGFYYEDRSANSQTEKIGTDATFDDGQRHLFAIAMENLDASTGQIYVDNGFVPTTTYLNDGASADTFPASVAFNTLSNSDGTQGNFTGLNLGRVLVADTALSESELDTVAKAHGFNP